MLEPVFKPSQLQVYIPYIFLYPATPTHYKKGFTAPQGTR